MTSETMLSCSDSHGYGASAKPVCTGIIVPVVSQTTRTDSALGLNLMAPLPWNGRWTHLLCALTCVAFPMLTTQTVV